MKIKLTTLQNANKLGLCHIANFAIIIEQFSYFIQKSFEIDAP